MTENAYDVTQYISHPYSQSHPDHLQLLGELFALQPKPWKASRILELGCASGANIIPIAMNAPDAQVVGVELSQKQVESGQAEIKALGLKNIEIQHRSIMDINKDDGLFDYIIVHGVWSWVPEDVRQGIFAVLKNNMSEQGIAYVSYNTFPGWNMVLSVRNMMTYHAAGFTTDKEKAQQCRLLLKFIVDGLKDDVSPYANFLRSEIQLVSRQTDNYIMHEYLEAENHPVYFHEFANQAQKYDLSYLADTFLPDMFAYNLPEQFAKEIAKIDNIIRANQYMDFIKNRRFRCTLLCHANNKVNRQLSFDRVRKNFFTYTGLRVENVDESKLAEGVALNFTNNLVTLSVKSKISKVAMWLLQNQKGKPIAFSTLCQMTMEYLNANGLTEIENHLINDLNILRLVLGGLLTLHLSDGDYTLKLGDKPKISKLAEYQIQKQNYVTNQRHQLVGFTPFEHVLLKEVDGKKTISEISLKLVDKALGGEIKLQREDGSQITDKEEIERRVPLFCKEVLDKFAIQALLVNL